MTRPFTILSVVAIVASAAYAVSLAQEPKYKLGIEFQPAVVITAVEPGSLAERYGLVKGDVVLEVADRALDLPVAFFQKVAKDLDENGSVKLKVLRHTPEGPRQYTVSVAR